MIVRSKIEKPLEGEFVKVVVDIEKQILAHGCELHIDCAEELMENGSSGKDLWGANVYPQEKRIDFVSMINIRPKDENRSMEILISDIRKQVETIIHELLF